MGGHSISGRSLRLVGADDSAEPSESGPAETAPRPEVPSFGEVYDAYFDYVWRSARRLGIAESKLDDVAQDVFVTVHRRLPDFEGRSTIKTWLFGITLRVVRDYRRSARRKPTHPLLAEPQDPRTETPHDAVVRNEAAQLLHTILDGLSDDKREVFVLMEIEQRSAPEVAELLDLNVNTVYGRIRAARRDFEQAVARLRAVMQRRGK